MFYIRLWNFSILRKYVALLGVPGKSYPLQMVRGAHPDLNIQAFFSAILPLSSIILTFYCTIVALR
jgi:hypothetical protein